MSTPEDHRTAAVDPGPVQQRLHTAAAALARARAENPQATMTATAAAIDALQAVLREVQIELTPVLPHQQPQLARSLSALDEACDRLAEARARTINAARHTSHTH